MLLRSSLTCESLCGLQERRKDQAKVGRHCVRLGFSDAADQCVVLCVWKCGEESD